MSSLLGAGCEGSGGGDAADTELESSPPCISADAAGARGGCSLLGAGRGGVGGVGGTDTELES